MDIGFLTTVLVFLVCNSIFFYYKGYSRAKKDNQIVDSFAGKIPHIINDSVARGAILTLENLERYEAIGVYRSEEVANTETPKIYKLFQAQTEEVAVNFEFLYDPKTNTYQVLTDTENE